MSKNLGGPFDRGLLIGRVHLAEVLGALADDVGGPLRHDHRHCLPVRLGRSDRNKRFRS
jgi:hypothetical protein